MVTKVTCSRCGGKFDPPTLAGRFAKFAKALAPASPVWTCAACDDELDALEEQAARRERRVLVATTRRRHAGIPARLQRVTFQNLANVPPNAIHAAEEWASGKRRGLVLTGNVGAGKTWIAAAAANRMLDNRRLRWCGVASMMIQLSAAFGDEDRAQAIRNLTGNGPLVLDDLDKVKASPYAISHLYAAIDNRIVHDAPLLVTTNLNLTAVASMLGEPIASRLEGYCRVVTLMARDRRRHSNRDLNSHNRRL